jgi:DNA-binding transcriptional ArsR family regulator
MPKSRQILKAIAEPSRLRLLQALSTPASVTELVAWTGLRQTNVSNHLARLREDDLVVATRRGRVVEYRLADATIAQLVESLSVLAGPPPARERVLMSEARTCYDHLAGRLGVALFDALLESEAIRDDHHLGRLRLGPRADEIFTSLGVNLNDVLPLRRRLAYRCLDWTERRAHLGGGLGAALADTFLRDRLVKRRRGKRGLDVTPGAWLRIAKLEPAHGLSAPPRTLRVQPPRLA